MTKLLYLENWNLITCEADDVKTKTAHQAVFV
jgi:hypothetical protein